MAEQRFCKPQVGGSIPLASSIPHFLCAGASSGVAFFFAAPDRPPRLSPSQSQACSTRSISNQCDGIHTSSKISSNLHPLGISKGIVSESGGLGLWPWERRTLSLDAENGAKGQPLDRTQCGLVRKVPHIPEDDVLFLNPLLVLIVDEFPSGTKRPGFIFPTLVPPNCNIHIRK